jgi:3',5'-cyclic AMP phosphodiesterase CpdA
MAFSFIQITDHHLRENEALLSRGYSTAYAFRATLRHIAQQHADVDFIVSTGDLVDTGTAAEYQNARRMLGLSETSAPPGPQRITVEGLREKLMYFLPGNHDPREAFFCNMFPASSLRAMNVAFVHQGIQFICIDWGGENKAIPSVGMFDFLTQSLQHHAPSIILTHHHVSPTGIARLDAFMADAVATFADLIKERNVLGIFSGHAHVSYEARIADVPVYGLRSTTFSFVPQGNDLLYVIGKTHYRLVTVRAGTLSAELVEVVL